MYIFHRVVGGKPLFSNIFSERDVQSREGGCAMMVHMWVWTIDIITRVRLSFAAVVFCVGCCDDGLSYSSLLLVLPPPLLLSHVLLLSLRGGCCCYCYMTAAPRPPVVVAVMMMMIMADGHSTSNGVGDPDVNSITVVYVTVLIFY